MARSSATGGRSRSPPTHVAPRDAANWRWEAPRVETNTSHFQERSTGSAKCAEARQPLRDVYMSFMLRDGWYCQFLEADLKTPLPRNFTFATPEKVVELVERGRGLKDLASKQALEHGIQTGRGGINLQGDVLVLLQGATDARWVAGPDAESTAGRLVEPGHAAGDFAREPW